MGAAATPFARCEPLAVLTSVFLNAQCKGASYPAVAVLHRFAFEALERRSLHASR
jgi:hypothetical protein